MPGAYSARHARARPSVRQWVLAIRETMVIKPSRLNIVAQDLSNSLPRSIISPYTHLSLGWALTRLQTSRLVESITRKERSCSIFTLHTPSGKPGGVALHYTCPTPEAVHINNFKLFRGARKIRELKQARSKPDTVDQPVRTAHIFVHHYNSTQYCKTETFFLIFPFLQTNITSQMWPSGGKGEFT